MASYQPTAEIPVMGTRRKAMLQALDNGSLIDLLNVMYTFADQDYRASLPGAHAQKRTAKASMAMMRHDRDSGKRDMLKLLHAIPKPVIRAVIENTIGHRYVTEPGFKDHLSTADPRSSGIYLNTILVEGTGGRSLSANEWRDVRDLILRYQSGAGILISNVSPATEKANANVANQIETAYATATGYTKIGISAGQRHLINSHGKTNVFYERLGDRVKHAFDLDTRQLQCPCEVDLSHDLPDRMKDHHPASGLRITVKTWSLVLRALKVLEIPVQPVSIVILKVWDKGIMILLAGISVTMLASAPVEDGGFNPTQAGGSAVSDKTRFDNEMHDVFVEHEYLNDNFSTSEAELSKRNASLKSITRFDSKDIAGSISELGNNLAEITNARVELEVDLTTGLEKRKSEIDSLPSQIQDVTECINRTHKNVAFHNSISDWLGEDGS